MTTATVDSPDAAASAAPHENGDTEAPSDVEVRDAAAIDCRDWPDRPLSGPTTGDRDGRFQVVYHQSALDAIHLHGQTRTDVEVGGVLLGTGHRDAHGPYLLVEHAIAGTSASSRSTNVTFTADTWQQIQTVWDRDFPDKKMVGWYHTHPGFGIFLSGMDVFICDNFFNLPWQIAFVYDPLGGDEGNFVWRGGKPTREPILLEDDVTPQSAAVPLMPLAEAMTGTDPLASGGMTTPPPSPPLSSPVSSTADAAVAYLPTDTAAALQSQTAELMARVRLLERRLKAMAFAMLFLAVFVAVCVVTLIWTGLTAAPGLAVPVQPASERSSMLQPPVASPQPSPLPSSRLPSSPLPSSPPPGRAVVAPHTQVGH